MNEYIISIIENPTTYLMISFAFSLCIFAWFLGFGIKLVISLLYKLLNVV